MKKKTHIVGIDEAGRGPLAGPVSVGVACVPKDFDWKLLSGVNDSKKLSEKKREEIFTQARQLQKEGMLDYKVSMVSASVIDKVGISAAVRLGIERGLRRLRLNPEQVVVKLDGLLKAPSEYKDQETIIKGDAKERVIGLASIMAKVTRDRYMIRIAKKYPQYHFEIHKGYGTKKHCDSLVVLGRTDIHRKSFTKKY